MMDQPRMQGQPTPATTQDPASNPMQRRLQQSETDPHTAVQSALDALRYLPDHIQEAYAPTLIRAQMKLERQGG